MTDFPKVNLYGGPPFFKVYTDQATSCPSFLVGGDSLLATRTGFNHKGKAFPNVASLSSVIQHGNVDRVPVRDIPPTEFVNSVCKEFNVQLLIGGVDDSELLYPIISNNDILQLGHITNINDIGEFVHFVSVLLTKKYPSATTPRYISSKVESFIEHGCVSAVDRHTLLWPGMHEGMSLRDAHLFAQLLVKGRCRPLVITIANGLSSLFPLESVLEANPEVFPSYLYEDVHAIAGFVKVMNIDRHSGKYTNKTSNNLVSYLVGRPWPSPKPWISSDVLPALKTVLIENATLAVAPDYNSDDQRISPQSLVVVVQTRFVREVTEAFLTSRLCSLTPSGCPPLAPDGPTSASRRGMLNALLLLSSCSLPNSSIASLPLCFPAPPVSRVSYWSKHPSLGLTDEAPPSTWD